MGCVLLCYYMIRNFKNRGPEDIFEGIDSKNARKTCLRHLWNRAYRKLDLLDSVQLLNDLRIPPGNKLESLKDERTKVGAIQ